MSTFSISLLFRTHENRKVQGMARKSDCRRTMLISIDGDSVDIKETVWWALQQSTHLGCMKKKQWRDYTLFYSSRWIGNIDPTSNINCAFPGAFVEATVRDMFHSEFLSQRHPFKNINCYVLLTLFDSDANITVESLATFTTGVWTSPSHYTLWRSKHCDRGGRS